MAGKVLSQKDGGIMLKRKMWACPLEKFIKDIQISHFLYERKHESPCFLCEYKCKPIKVIVTIKEVK